MKKSFISIFVLTTFIFFLTSHLNAQTFLDVRHSDGIEHLKMLEPFVGKWQRDVDNDTVWILEIIPSEVGEGYLAEYYRIVNGKSENLTSGIIGWAGPRGDQQLTWYSLWSNGWTSRDVGKFMSEKKMLWLRYTILQNHQAIWEWEMKTPDKIEWVYVWREGWTVENWQKKPLVYRQTWNRVK